MEDNIIDIESPVKEKLEGDKESSIDYIINKLKENQELIDLDSLNFINAVINASIICNNEENLKDTIPYHYKTNTEIYIEKVYNPKYGDNKVCICGDSYEKHFDSWDEMTACGCKYCECDHFKEKTL